MNDRTVCSTNPRREPDRVVAERDHDDPGDDDREADFEDRL